MDQVINLITRYWKKAQWLRFKGSANKYEETYYVGYQQALEMVLNLIKEGIVK